MTQYQYSVLRAFLFALRTAQQVLLGGTLHAFDGLLRYCVWTAFGPAFQHLLHDAESAHVGAALGMGQHQIIVLRAHQRWFGVQQLHDRSQTAGRDRGCTARLPDSLVTYTYYQVHAILADDLLCHTFACFFCHKYLPCSWRFSYILTFRPSLALFSAHAFARIKFVAKNPLCFLVYLFVGCRNCS